MSSENKKERIALIVFALAILFAIIGSFEVGFLMGKGDTKAPIIIQECKK